MPEIAPEPGDLIVTSKHRLSSFIDTDLESWLRTLGIETLLMLGINTNTCVQCAAFEAFNRDYGVVIVSDCVHSMNGDDLHEFGLDNVARCIGWVLSVDEVIEKLEASPVGATAEGRCRGALVTYPRAPATPRELRTPRLGARAQYRRASRA